MEFVASNIPSGQRKLQIGPFSFSGLPSQVSQFYAALREKEQRGSIELSSITTSLGLSGKKTCGFVALIVNRKHDKQKHQQQKFPRRNISRNSIVVFDLLLSKSARIRNGETQH